MSIPQGTDLSHIPALQPPQGVVPNFAHPKSRAHATIVGNGVATAIMMMFVISRMYTKLFVSKLFGWEDCTQTLLLVVCCQPAAYVVYVDACAIATAMALGYLSLLVYSWFHSHHKLFNIAEVFSLQYRIGSSSMGHPGHSSLE